MVALWVAAGWVSVCDMALSTPCWVVVDVACIVAWLHPLNSIPIPTIKLAILRIIVPDYTQSIFTHENTSLLINLYPRFKSS